MTRLFADDTSLRFSSVNLFEIERVFNEDLSKLSARAKRWLIKFNAQKTEIMLNSNAYNDHNIELIMDNTILQIVNSQKHFGVVLSSNNKWTTHIDTIIQSASKQISFLRKLKYKFSKNSLNKINCTYIRPLLECTSKLCDGCNQTDADRLEKVVKCSKNRNLLANIFFIIISLF